MSLLSQWALHAACADHHGMPRAGGSLVYNSPPLGPPTSAARRLQALGLAARTKDAAAGGGTFPYVLFSAPPSGSADYLGEIKAALALWDGTGAFVFTSSAGVYTVEDGSGGCCCGPSEREGQGLRVGTGSCPGTTPRWRWASPACPRFVGTSWAVQPGRYMEGKLAGTAGIAARLLAACWALQHERSVPHPAAHPCWQPSLQPTRPMRCSACSLRRERPHRQAGRQRAHRPAAGGRSGGAGGGGQCGAPGGALPRHAVSAG